MWMLVYCYRSRVVLKLIWNNYAIWSMLLEKFCICKIRKLINAHINFSIWLRIMAFHKFKILFKNVVSFLEFCLVLNIFSVILANEFNEALHWICVHFILKQCHYSIAITKIIWICHHVRGFQTNHRGNW